MKQIKEIKGYEWVNDSYFVTRKGKVLKIKNGKLKILKLYSVSSKETKPLQVKLYGEESKHKSIYVHRLVKTAFDYVENCESLCVHHIDENKENNNIENLEWKTMSEHTRLHNDTKFDKISNREMNAIKKLSELGFSAYSIEEIFGISRATISDLLNGKTYK